MMGMLPHIDILGLHREISAHCLGLLAKKKKRKRKKRRRKKGNDSNGYLKKKHMMIIIIIMIMNDNDDKNYLAGFRPAKQSLLRRLCS